MIIELDFDETVKLNRDYESEREEEVRECERAYLRESEGVLRAFRRRWRWLRFRRDCEEPERENKLGLGISENRTRKFKKKRKMYSTNIDYKHKSLKLAVFIFNVCRFIYYFFLLFKILFFIINYENKNSKSKKFNWKNIQHNLRTYINLVSNLNRTHR